MKKYLNVFIVSILSVTMLSACGSTNSTQVVDDNATKIVVTIFPEYDWVMNILGNNPADVQVNLLLDNGVDLHSYQPTALDIMNISTCDMFIYVGGESDAWVAGALRDSANPDRIVVNLMDILGADAKEEETVEGMQEEEEEHEHEEAEYDEHVWLSLRNTSRFIEHIAKSLGTIDQENAQVYQANADAYTAKLNALDAQYAEAVSNAKTKTLLFADRFPFRYLTDDYGLSYFAAFSGCSAESEASFETIMFLSNKADELNLPALMTIEGTDHRIAETVLQNMANKNLPILSLNSMQSTTSMDIQNGVTYLSIMESNLEVLKEALK